MVIASSFEGGYGVVSSIEEGVVRCTTSSESLEIRVGAPTRRFKLRHAVAYPCQTSPSTPATATTFKQGRRQRRAETNSNRSQEGSQTIVEPPPPPSNRIVPSRSALPAPTDGRLHYWLGSTRTTCQRPGHPLRVSCILTS